ncbi:hypothetical protein [Natrinema versiforme]|uniref:Uncharacterized protein n=1 Tax=Natrinema versiforme JCM 10478 TaxID=1227496 RepID=L9YAB7_9EURY|nr:hypothetical protein C489_01536 [Natrinema versiforme JCM 10478]
MGHGARGGRDEPARFRTGETYRKGLNTGLDLAIQKGATNWLADLRDLGTLSQDDQQWTQEVWHPRAFESSLSYMAIVQPESVVTNLSVDDLVQEVGSNVTSHMFDNRSDAEDWLREQQQEFQWDLQTQRSDGEKRRGRDRSQ